MKLKLEHLAPYLPYALPFNYDYQADKYRFTGTGIMDGITSLGENHLLIDYSGGSIHIKHCKLILYNLSYLTKEIEVGGEKFIPIDKLSEWLYNEESENFGDISDAKNWINAMINLECREYINLPYKIVLKLISWHFAVNIPKHLYINKHTL